MPIFSTEVSPLRGSAIPNGRDFRCLVDVDAPCNLVCTYCSRRRRGVRIGREAALALAHRLADEIERSRAKTATVVFFGGEPLLQRDLLLDQARVLTERLARTCIRFEADLITNGTLLDGTIPAQLARTGFTRALVTLAGPRGLHDARRRLEGAFPSYERILENLSSARTHLHIFVRHEVVDATDLAEAPKLLDDLAHRGLLDGAHPVEPVMQGRCSYANQARSLASLEWAR